VEIYKVRNKMIKNKYEDFENRLRKYLKANPDIIESIKANDMDRLNLPDAWKQEVEKNNTPEKQALAQKMINDAMRKVAKQRKRRRVVFGTTIAIAACLALFLGVTSPGQALARGVITTIVNIFNGNVRIETDGLDTNQSRIDDLEYKEFIDVSEAAIYAGQQLIYVDGTDATINKISVEAVDGIQSIITEYALPDGRIFIVFQRIYDLNDNIAFELNTNDNYFEHSLFNVQVMYCMTHEDNTYSGMATWDNIELNIVSEKIGWDELINYVDAFINY
jgi:hypothetical protein